MTQEEKELLRKDLYSRLLYKPKVHIEHDIFYDEREPYDTELDLSVLYNRCAGMEIKPYLRSIKDMTPAEKAYYFAINEEPITCMDWLNKNHFDYRGLIEKGLALEAPKNMYNNKK